LVLYAMVFPYQTPAKPVSGGGFGGSF
jgi:hypothetical protein